MRKLLPQMTHNNGRYLVGEAHRNWKGGRTRCNGYINVLRPDNPRASYGYVGEHIVIVEEVIGHHLPPGACVHHVNSDRGDNRHENLVACQSDGYHNLLHQRAKALAASGNANYRKCRICKNYDDPSRLYISAANKAQHRECGTLRQREYRKRRKGCQAP